MSISFEDCTGNLVRWISGNTAVVDFTTGVHAGQRRMMRDWLEDQPSSVGPGKPIAQSDRALLYANFLAAGQAFGGFTVGVDLAGRVMAGLTSATADTSLNGFWINEGRSNEPTSAVIANPNLWTWAPRLDYPADWNPLKWLGYADGGA